MSLPVVAVGTLINVTVLGTVVSRLLGVRFSVTRLVLAAVLGLVAVRPVMTGLLGPTRPDGGYAESPSALVVVLALLLILLPSMVFLVVVEALAPSGTLPTPFELVRGLRGR